MLPSEPEFEEAKEHFFAGLDFLSLGKWCEAEAEFRHSLAIVPDRLSSLTNLSSVLIKQGKLEESRIVIQRCIELDPTDPEVALNSSLLYLKEGRVEEALIWAERVIQQEPQKAEAWNNRGLVFEALHNYSEALTSYTKAIELRADYAQAWLNRGNALDCLHQHQDALYSLDQSIALLPTYAEAWSNRCHVLCKLERYKEALAAGDKAVEIHSGDSKALLNRGNALGHLGRYEEALRSYDESIAADPHSAEAWSNRCHVLYQLGLYKEALASAAQATTLRSDYAEAWLNRGLASFALGQVDESLLCYDQSILLKPDYVDAFWNKAMTLLAIGEFEAGWPLYEWRWRIGKSKSVSGGRFLQQSLWLGKEDIKNKTLFIYAEQGYGDTIQFCRYASLLKDLGAHVVLQVQSPLQSLLRSLDGPSLLIGMDEEIPAFDFRCPLLSLPLALDTRIETIPKKSPYLSVPHSIQRAWSDLLGVDQERPTIGIVWAGNPSHENDKHRSVALRVIEPMLSDQFRWVSLQKAVSTADREILERTKVLDFSCHLNDFLETAGLISNLDLVVCVDTSVAHLAGALGKDVWVLLPRLSDFRWMLEREDSPWYPSARLFRQKHIGDWSGVIQQVEITLKGNFLDRWRDQSA